MALGFSCRFLVVAVVWVELVVVFLPQYGRLYLAAQIFPYRVEVRWGEDRRPQVRTAGVIVQMGLALRVERDWNRVRRKCRSTGIQASLLKLSLYG